MVFRRSAPVLAHNSLAMNMLIVYGTNSSGTAVVADSIAETLRAAGHQLTVQHARDTTVDLFTKDFDLVILGSCTWERFTADHKKLEGQLQQHMLAFVEAATPPAQQRFALFGLGDSSYTSFCAAADHLETAVTKWNGQLVHPTLRIDAYFFDLKKNRQRVTDWAQALVQKVS